MIKGKGKLYVVHKTRFSFIKNCNAFKFFECNVVYAYKNEKLLTHYAKYCWKISNVMGNLCRLTGDSDICLHY